MTKEDYDERDRQLTRLGYTRHEKGEDNYADYRADTHWRLTSRNYLAKHVQCEATIGNLSEFDWWDCPEPAVEVHHRHYRTLGNEADEDLLALCHRCHHTEHYGKSPVDMIEDDAHPDEWTPKH